MRPHGVLSDSMNCFASKTLRNRGVHLLASKTTFTITFLDK